MGIISVSHLSLFARSRRVVYVIIGVLWKALSSNEFVWFELEKAHRFKISLFCKDILIGICRVSEILKIKKTYTKCASLQFNDFLKIQTGEFAEEGLGIPYCIK